MIAIRNNLVLAAAAVALAVPGTAMASWASHHPRRAEVNHRLQNLNRRIGVERREGELTAAQAHQLRAQDRSIRREERTMARFDKGHITKADQRALNQQENGVSRGIGN